MLKHVNRWSDEQPSWSRVPFHKAGPQLFAHAERLEIIYDSPLARGLLKS
jgi:hypothetical protein